MPFLLLLQNKQLIVQVLNIIIEFERYIYCFGFFFKLKSLNLKFYSKDKLYFLRIFNSVT